jgi:ATP-dependent Clp protease ATP-binding subunit ClpC
MFERFTERARQVVVLAQDEARALNHNYIGTEHLLLGLLREEQGLGARVLGQLGIELAEARAYVRDCVGVGSDAPSGQIPFTPRAKRALELSLREAVTLGHGFIGTEHVLLGLVRVDDGVAARYLAEREARGDTVRDAVIGAMGGTRYPREAFVEPRRAWRPPVAVLAALASLAAGVLIGWAIWG